MLDRRTFLTTSLAIAALPVAARAAAAPAVIEGAIVEPLDRLSERHPGFAYFAGLPGHLGMPFAQRMQWAATPTALQAFAELQTQCGVACVIIGSSDPHDTSSGLNAAVLSAIGSQRPSASVISPYGTTVTLLLPRAAWTALDDRTRAAINTAASRMRRDAQNRAAPRHAATPPDIEKISEAVVASIATHDALTQRINASYFACRKAAANLRAKNAV